MSIVVATTDTTVAGVSRPVVIRKGEAWDADDPIVKANPLYFTADPAKARTTVPRQPEVVEQSTKAPGERSQVRRG
jgi:hypothetical protein